MTPVLLLASDNPFTWFALVPGLKEHPQWTPFYLSMTAVVLLLGLAFLARLGLPRDLDRRESLVPQGRLTVRTLFELLGDALLGLVKSNLGHDAHRYYPLLAGAFLYILFNNLLGLVPGFSPPTANINTNIGMGLTIFLVYNLSGLIRQGPVDYIKHFMGPVWYLAWLMLPIEIIGHLARPASLSIRLYGNMTGDHTVLDIFMVQLPHATFPILAFGIPVVFLALGLFVCVVQAFVFTLLSTIYISQAVAHEEHH